MLAFFIFTLLKCDQQISVCDKHDKMQARNGKHACKFHVVQPLDSYQKTSVRIDCLRKQNIVFADQSTSIMSTTKKYSSSKICKITIFSTHVEMSMCYLFKTTIMTIIK